MSVIDDWAPSASQRPREANVTTKRIPWAIVGTIADGAESEGHDSVMGKTLSV